MEAAEQEEVGGGEAGEVHVTMEERGWDTKPVSHYQFASTCWVPYIMFSV